MTKYYPYNRVEAPKSRLEWTLKFIAVFSIFGMAFVLGALYYIYPVLLFLGYYFDLEFVDYSITYGLTFLWTLYLVHLVKDDVTVSNKWDWYNHLVVWDWYLSLFPINLHYLPADISPKDRYIFTVHPHGSFGICSAPYICGSHPFFKKLDLNILAAKAIMGIPMVRDVFRWQGFLDASFPSAEKKLKNGGSLAIFTGGEAESFVFKNNGEVDLVLYHKGFIRLAMTQGCNVIPTFCFGQNDIYKQYLNLFHGFRFWLMRQFRVLILFFHGSFLFIPYFVPIDVVHGEVIQVPKMANPTEEDIEKYHSIYVKETIRLYEENKEKFGYGNRKLVIMEKNEHKKLK